MPIHNTAVLFTDFDDTLVPIHGRLDSRQVAILESLICSNTLMVCITGADSRDIEDRLGRRISPTLRESLWLSACYGLNLFRLDEQGRREYAYDNTYKMDRYRDRIAIAVSDVASNSGLGPVVKARGIESRSHTVCIEHKDGQVTLTLLGIEGHRRQLAATLRRRLNLECGDNLKVEIVGRKSIDIRLTDSGKGDPVRYIMRHRARFNLHGGVQVMIAGDKFGSGEADEEMLDESIAGATVFSASTNAPRLPGFRIASSLDVDVCGTYKFLQRIIQDRKE